MNKGILAAAVLAGSIAAFPTFAEVDQYLCTVYCLGPYESTQTEVPAASANDAAQKVDAQSDKICQASGHVRSTPMTMKPEQCVKKK